MTDFGDAAVLMPLSALIGVWLVATRPSASALWWLVALVVCNGITAVLKIYFFACPPMDGLHSPSGHTSYSVITYGGLAAIVALEHTARWRRIAIALAGAGFVIAIAVSRVLLGRHSFIEIGFGLAIGSLALSLFIVRYRRLRVRGRVAALLVGAVIVVGLFHGNEAHFENFLHTVSEWLGIRRFACS